MPNLFRILAVAGAAAGLFFGLAQARAEENSLTVFAAASTTNALTEIAALYEAEGKGGVAFSFASSSTLAKQIESGAPADVFISANVEWMDYLEEKDLLASGSRVDILGNRIVFIVPASSPVEAITVSPQLDLGALLGKDGLISVGDPAHVPVGTYAKAALEHLGLWAQAANKIAPAKDVRAGLVLVERGESPLGIVYASDAVISDRVRVVGTFPSASHPEINYPAAALKTSKNRAALDFIKFLATPPAAEIWARYGFEVK